MANPADLQVEFEPDDDDGHGGRGDDGWGDDGRGDDRGRGDDGRGDGGRGGRAGRRGRAVLAAGALLAAGVTGATIRGGDGTGRGPAGAASSAPLVSTVPSAFGSRPVAARGTVRIHSASVAIAPTGLRAVALLGDGRLARLDLDHASAELIGPVIAEPSDAALALVAGRDWVLARPLGQAHAVLVPDDGTAGRDVGLALGDRAAGVYTGGRDDAVWVAAEGTKPSASYAQLVDLGGRTVGTSYPLNGVTPLGPDGRGELLVASTGGTFVTGAGSYHLLTTGAVVAVSAARLVTVECDSALACRRWLVERASGERSDLGATVPYGPPRAPGVVSPSGAKVALRTANGAGIEIVDTVTLASTIVEASREPIPLAAAGPVAWSTDERSLVYLDRTTGHLAVYDTVTGMSTDVFTELPAISTLAFRPE